MRLRIGRLALGLLLTMAGGAVATLGYGRLMLWMGGTCSVACDPATGILLGAFAGGLAFALDVGGFRSAVVRPKEEDAGEIDMRYTADRTKCEGSP